MARWGLTPDSVPCPGPGRVSNSPQQARETAERGGGGQLLRHLEDKQGQRAGVSGKDRALPSGGGEVLKCGWGKGARVWFGSK